MKQSAVYLVILLFAVACSEAQFSGNLSSIPGTSKKEDDAKPAEPAAEEPTVLPATAIAEIPCSVTGKNGIINFEKLPDGSTPADGAVITNQFKDSHGISFSIEGGGDVTIAKVGAPATAFTCDTNCPSAGKPREDGTTDAEVGDYFLTQDSGSKGAKRPLLITYESPVSAASGSMLDIDALEKWTIEALSVSGAVIESVVLEDTGDNKNDGKTSYWSIDRKGTRDIASIRIRGEKPSGGLGIAFDLFSPSQVCAKK